MERRDLNRMFDALAPTQEQEQAGLSRLLQTERKGRPMKKLKKLTVLGVAAALMVISCAAAVVTGLDQRLADYFGASPEQAELLLPGAVPVDVAVEDNGAALHVTQVLMDRYNIMLLADFTAPEGTVLDRDDYAFNAPMGLMPDLLNQAGKSVEIEQSWSWAMEVLDDGEPQDSHLTLLFRLGVDEGIQPDWNISGISMHNGNLIRYGEEPWDIITIWSGDLSCEVPFTWQDMGKGIQPDQVVGELDGIDITLTELYLSPMTLKINLKSEIPIPQQPGGTIGIRWSQLGIVDNFTLTDKNGKTIALTDLGGSGSKQDQDRIYQLAEITALEDLEGGALNIRIEGGSVDVPLDGLVPAE